MALILIATPGATDANSLTTLAFADAYFDGRPGAEAWNTASDFERSRALVGATMRLESERYAGGRASDTQALSWPRTGVTIDGVTASSESVPVVVQRACCEEALALMDDDSRFDASGLEAFESVQVGSLAVDLRPDTAGPAPLTPMATRWLTGLRRGGRNTVEFLPS